MKVYTDNIKSMVSGLILLFCLFTVAMVLVDLNKWDGTFQVYTISFVVINSIALVFSYLRLKHGMAMQPMLVIIVSFLIGALGKVLYFSIESESSYNIGGFLLQGKGISVIVNSYMVLTVAVLSLVIAYSFGSNNKFSRPTVIRMSYDNRALKNLVFVFFVIGFLSFLIIITGGVSSMGSEVEGLSGKRFNFEGQSPSARFSDPTYLAFKFSVLLKVSFYFYFILALSVKRRLRYWFLAVLSFLLSIFVSFYFSNRIGVIVLFLDLVFILYFFKKGISIKLLIGVFISVLFLFILMSVLRSSSAESKTILEHLFGGRYLMDLTRTAHLYDFFSSKGSLLSYFTSTELSSLVKVYLDLGRASGVMVFNTVASGVPLGLPAELFMVGGWGGVVIGMLLFGFGLRYLTHLISKVKVYDYTILLYTLAATRLGLFSFNNGAGVMVFQLLIDALPLLFLLFIYKLFVQKNEVREIYVQR